MDKQGYIPIYCRITIDGIKDEISTGLKVLHADWDTKISRCSRQSQFIRRTIRNSARWKPTYGETLIKADSSLPDALWLEPGTYEIYLKEIRIDGVERTITRIDSLVGPQDALIFWGFQKSRYSIRGKSSDETKLKQASFASTYIDSVFNHIPTSKVLPTLIRLSKDYLGDEQARRYVAMLSQMQKSSDNATVLEDYFIRQDKFRKEILFEDFKMKDEHGKVFQLSSLKAKLILLDFWSSNCFACRKQHEKFAVLYSKFQRYGLEIVSISLDQQKADWLKAIAQDKMSWKNVSDLKGWDSPLAKRYFISVIPSTVWLAENRKIIGGQLDESAIKQLLGMP